MSVAFVLGNGRSRMGLDLQQLSTQGPIYGCNALYREFTPTVLVSTDRPISTAIQQSGYPAQHTHYTRKPIPGLGSRAVPQKYFGFSSGPLATAIAALDGHDAVYLIGFDMSGLPGEKFNNVYADTEFYKKSTARPTYTGNWTRQLCHIARDFPRIRFVRVHGETTGSVAQFDGISNLYKLTLHDFQNRLNNPKEL
jgi:hypothetical protein